MIADDDAFVDAVSVTVEADVAAFDVATAFVSADVTIGVLDAVV